MKKTLPILLIVLVAAGFGAWWQFGAQQSAPITTFEDCVAAGNPVMESHPRQCRAGGQTFVEDVGNEVQKSDLIRLDSPRANQTVSSPLTITGEARGNWYFEASFPVVLTNWDGLIIAQGIATAKGNWMTTEFVPFEATLTFVVDKNAYSNRGSLILQKDNPSGLPEHDDALEIPIVFAAPPTSTILHAAMGETVTGLGVSLTPLEVISDSRCPIDVQCIWAGTVEVKVRIQSGLGTSNMTLELGKPVTTEVEVITLTEVSPAKSAGTAIPASSYRLTFEIKKR